MNALKDTELGSQNGEIYGGQKAELEKEKGPKPHFLVTDLNELD